MHLFSFTYEQITKLNIKDFFVRLYTKALDEEDVTSNAAQVAFYFLLALFPLLLFLVSVFGIVLGTADDLRAEMFFYLKQAMPYSAYDLVVKTIDEVTQNSSGGKLTFGLLAALWAASAGIDSIRVVLNGVYNLSETRPWWKTKLTSVLLTLGLGILVTLALGIVFYGSKLIMLVLDTVNLPIQSPTILGILQGIFVLIVLVAIFGLLYNFLPNHKEFKWVWVSPGSIIGILLWLLLSYGFKLYLGYFDSYDKTYGSLGAVIILMLWLYLTAFVILTGGSLNAVLQEFTDPEAAEAGANKAIAKEIADNPQSGDLMHHISKASEKKAESLAALNKVSGKDTGQPVTKEPKAISAEIVNDDEDDKPEVHKSKLKLITGLIIGFVSNLRKR
jgi:membrane protein